MLQREIGDPMAAGDGTKFRISHDIPPLRIMTIELRYGPFEQSIHDPIYKKPILALKVNGPPAELQASAGRIDWAVFCRLSLLSITPKLEEFHRDSRLAHPAARAAWFMQQVVRWSERTRQPRSLEGQQLAQFTFSDLQCHVLNLHGRPVLHVTRRVPRHDPRSGVPRTTLLDTDHRETPRVGNGIGRRRANRTSTLYSSNRVAVVVWCFPAEHAMMLPCTSLY
ncbi:uncharacterized protein PFLUO_LOCUS638 [Penicillium psychrofluorescens]|uniref:uncharacterized protein n=1 Tax=Penicillium psychrofluorescens TaxID=3158075 RepID=UPI003CCCA783